MSAIEELYEMRNLIRAQQMAFRATYRSPQAKAVINEMDGLCTKITGEVEYIQPSLLTPPLLMRVGGGVQ